MSDSIDVPNNTLIRCPLVAFSLTRAEKCAECASFKGLVDRFPGSGYSFTKRYLIQCLAQPVNREIFELVEDKQ